MDPVQPQYHSTTLEIPIVDAIDCICGMTIPPFSEDMDISNNPSSTHNTTSDSIFTIQCDECGRWLHGSCVGLTPEDVIPDTFSCPKCIQEKQAQQTHSRPVGRPRKSKTLIPIVTTPTSSTPANNASNLTIAGEELLYISTNSVAHDAISALKHLQVDYEGLLSKLPPSIDNSYGNVNFEFAGDIIPLPNSHTINELEKYIEVKEIKSRGSSSFSISATTQAKKNVKKGIFSMQYIDPGQSICEFCGHVMRIESIFAKIHKVVTIPQTFVLFPVNKADVIIDARKHGSPARWIRRSCRPNTLVKSVIHLGNVYWFIFAKYHLKPGDELFLPLDWDSGNRFFRYECACNSPQTCLAPDELLPEGYRENLMHKEDPISLINEAIVTTNSTVFDRKMSREERKLQRYIEAFEKLESTERKKSKSTPPDSSSPETSRKPSVSKLPVTIKTSTKKITIKSTLPLKKQWAKQSINIREENKKRPSTIISKKQKRKVERDPSSYEENIDVETIEEMGGSRQNTPISQLNSEEQVDSSSSAKRLSLSEFLHRKMNQQQNENSRDQNHQMDSSLPSKMRPLSEDEEMIHDSRKLSTSSSSRESGEYIETPSFISPVKYGHSRDDYRQYQDYGDNRHFNQNYRHHHQPQSSYNNANQRHHSPPSYSYHTQHQYNYNRQYPNNTNNNYDYENYNNYAPPPQPHYENEYERRNYGNNNNTSNNANIADYQPHYQNRYHPPPQHQPRPLIGGYRPPRFNNRPPRNGFNNASKYNHGQQYNNNKRRDFDERGPPPPSSYC